MQKLSVVGLMSGSSLDGVDLAWCEFTFAAAHSAQLINWQLHRGVTLPYPPNWQHRLRAAPELNGRELWLLHTELGRYFGELVRDFIATLPGTVDLVASHGHTVFHFPDQHTTTQIGDGAAMAGVLDKVVIDQFRALDMALGGQGAPLAPLADQYLLANYFACLNLGGIANVSIQTPKEYIAFDVSGANQVLDALVQEIGLPYDDNGQFARSGSLLPDLLAAANALPFYQLPPPKSLGNDWVREQLLPLFQQPSTGSLADRLHTYCFHVAEQLGLAVKKVIATEKLTLTGHETMLVTGGGGFNAFQCELIARAIAPIRLEPATPDLTAYKEAALMALAGALRWQEQPNVLPTVTGARRAAVGGAVHWGRVVD
ncbi:MAG: anhydro-N-acetylmuramic acid kinase [Bacteroidetes bacterium]|nr:MAG: anhydro-N-acetylmuramic acid kinase [Bacteroidota bacterium]PTM14778.1 MAG: anhydro-N-acetylmuramic acid kinase [Bacteroidota bacterium]